MTSAAVLPNPYARQLREKKAAILAEAERVTAQIELANRQVIAAMDLVRSLRNERAALWAKATDCEEAALDILAEERRR